MQQGDSSHFIPMPLWKNRDYLLLWSGQTVSVIGTQVSQIAFPLLVLALTGSPAQAGFVAAARTVPYLLFSLPAGALVDRWNRKLTMIVCSAGSAVALASVAVAYALGVLTLAQIVVVSFIEGSLAVFFRLAETSALPQVVHRSQLPTAVAQQNMQYSLGSIVGPPLGGALFSVSRLLPFVADATSYAASALSLATVRTRFQTNRAAPWRPLREEIGEGVGWLWRHALVRYMAFLTGSINFVTAGFTLLLIVVAGRQGASGAETGLIFAAGGVGATIGAFVAPRLQRWLTFGQAIIGLSWFYALVWLLLAGAHTPALLMALVFGASLITPTYDAVQMGYRLALVPDALQGRVNGVFRLVADGAKPLGAAATGIVLERGGATTGIVVSAGFLAVVALLTTLNRHVRHAPPIAELRTAE